MTTELRKPDRRTVLVNERLEALTRKAEKLGYAGQMKAHARHIALLIRAELLPEAMTLAQQIEAESDRELSRLGGAAA